MKVAIVHDYLNQAGGAERVVAVLHRMFPKAPIFTTLFDPQEIGRPLADADVRVSWMRRLPNWRRNFRSFMPLYPLAVRSFDLSGYDVVITSSSAFAKGVRVPREALHLCYCYTPMRWAWSFDRYTELSAMSSSAKLAAKLTLPALRRWDTSTSRGVDRFVAISTEVSHRIRATYGRGSEIVFPPVDVKRFRVDRAVGDYFLVVSRLNAYKRIDLAVRAFNQLRLPLIVVGNGPDARRLRRLAGPTVSFAGRVSDAEAARLLARARALVVTATEEFGIAAVEAQAAGRPVIALRDGGVRETVVEGVTGAFYETPEVGALVDAVRSFDALAVDPAACVASARRFDTAHFRRGLIAVVERVLGGRESRRAPRRRPPRRARGLARAG